jgi:NADH dehydrogenase [ubiquinone] 1 alpha subcomplex assembly factor 1
LRTSITFYKTLLGLASSAELIGQLQGIIAGRKPSTIDLPPFSTGLYIIDTNTESPDVHCTTLRTTCRIELRREYSQRVLGSSRNAVLVVVTIADSQNATDATMPSQKLHEEEYGRLQTMVQDRYGSTRTGSGYVFFPDSFNDACPLPHPLANNRAVFTQEFLDVPIRPYTLLEFSDPDITSDCKIMTDRELGGFSSGNLAYVPATSSAPAHAKFSGSIDTTLPPNKPKVQRTGYAAFRNNDRKFTLFGSGMWDIDPYTYLALNIKSDGRKYLINIQTDSIVQTDIHQHRLYSKTPGQWETVLVNWHEFVRTNHGTAINPNDMMRQKIKTLGIGLIDREPGPFEICVGRMWATNGLMTEDSEEGAEYRDRIRKETQIGEFEARKGKGWARLEGRLTGQQKLAPEERRAL